MKKALLELEESFQPYSLLWQEWIKYKHTSLTEEDIYIIQVHYNNNFQFIEYDAIMFYNKPGKIYQIVQKLNSDYIEFQEWAISKFFVTLMNMAVNHGLNSFLEKPIMFLNLSSELKRLLLSFGFNKLIELINTLEEKDFKEVLAFKNILDFLSTYSSERNYVSNVV